MLTVSGRSQGVPADRETRPRSPERLRQNVGRTSLLRERAPWLLGVGLLLGASIGWFVKRR